MSVIITGVLSPKLGNFIFVTHRFYKIRVLGENLIPLVVARNSDTIIPAICGTAHGGGAEGVVYSARSVGFAENETCIVQVDPADFVGNIVVGNEQTVLIGISVLRVFVCSHRSLLGGSGYTVGCRFQHIGVHRAHIGERHIVQGAVRQVAVYRSGNIHRRKVKIVPAAGGEGELFVHPLFHRQRDIRKCACKVGFVIAVVLLVKDLQGIGSLGKAGRNGKLCRAVCFRERGVAAAVIDRVAVSIKDQSGNIFVFAGFRAGI